MLLAALRPTTLCRGTSRVVLTVGYRRSMNLPWRNATTACRSFGLRIATVLLIQVFAAAFGYITAAEAQVRDPTLNRIASSGTLRLGARLESVPFSYQLPDGRATGYSVELCLYLAEQIRKRLRLARLQTEMVFLANVRDGMKAIKDNRIDIECGVTVDAAERRKEVSFSLPVFYSSMRVISPATLTIDRLTQLAGRRVAVPKATVAHRALLQLEGQVYPRPSIVEVETAEQGLDLLARGQVDAFANFEAQLRLWRARQPDPLRYRVGGEMQYLEPVALMLPRGDQEFSRVVDVILSHAMIDGVLTRLYKRWFEEPIPPDGLVLSMPMSELLRSAFAWPAPIER